MASSSSLDMPHIVVLPFAQQGHINPLLQLARKLAFHGLPVTFVVSENTVPIGTKASAISNLTYLGIPDNLPPHRSRGSNIRDSVDSMINMEAGFRHLLLRLHHLPRCPVSAVIYDAFMTWAHDIASDLSIPAISFFTSNATVCALLHHIPSLIARGVLPFRRDADDPLPQHLIEDIPGVPAILPEEFPQCVTFDPSHFQYQFLIKLGYGMQKASAVIVNAFEEMEQDAVDAMKAEKPIFTVGPLLLLSGRPSRLDVNYWTEEDHCLPWLDSQPPASVLYVSFGSVASLPISHLQELALGLEASEQRFLWVIRHNAVEGPPLEDILPDGFLTRTKDRGLIISWGPQLMILAHSSIGGFLTHGGWNSIIENVAMGSVPMICWPHMAEQRANRKLMVEQWKIGMSFRHEGDGCVAKDEVTCVVRELMEGKLGMELRGSSRKLGEMAEKAVAAGGSSQKSFEALVKFLMAPQQ